MKAGDVVYVMTNCESYAPSESVGMEGVIVEVLDGIVDGISYRGKAEVMFLEEVCGYRTWIYSLSELDKVSDFGDMSSRRSYKERG
jgi:hypothetical protein